jgi:glycosyltransferase involved in cell wall biosynthesis
MKRRLAIVTHYWVPHVGGIETVAREQARRLGEMGWQIDVFTTRLAGDSRCSMDGGTRVHRYRCINWQERKLSVPVPMPSPRMLTDLARYARRADVILVHGHCYPGSVFGACAARIAGRPLVVVQSNPFVDYPFPLAAVEQAVDRSIGRWVLGQAQVVVCVSRFVESFVHLIAPRASTVMIYSGVEIERFRPDGPSPRRSGLHVLTVRRLVPRNGVHVLLEAWRRAALSPGARLTIAGSGPEEGKLKQMAGEMASVRFLGHVPDEHLASLYRTADLFVVPSVSGEGFGIVAAEALASGVPVIATDGGATGEVVRHGSDGLIVPADDPDGLAAAIGQLERDPSLLAQMAAAARERRPQLCWGLSADRLARTLEASIADSPTAGAPLKALFL